MITFTKAVGLFLSLMAQKGAEKDFKPLDVITGTDSVLERPMAAMATDQRTMEQIWRQHKEIFGGEIQRTGSQEIEMQVPQVDFKKNLVIAFFAGQTTGVMGFEVVDVDTKGKDNIVRIAPKQFPNSTPIVANAFAMWVFPRTRKTIELQLVVSYENQKPTYVKVARFDPPKQAKG